jgi:stearoyl-CoA desaturase (delta-9 desaturase)
MVSNRVASNSRKPFSPNWRNILFVIPSHLIGLTAYPLYVWLGGGFAWVDLGIFLGMYALSAIGICIGYHRGFTHRAFSSNAIVRFLGLFGGAAAGEGSALSWCSDHRRHHQNEDTDEDPYNVKRGFWWAHMGWMLGSPTTTEFSNVKDLAENRMIKNQSDYYILWFALSSFVLPTLVGALFDRALAGLLCGGFLRLFCINHATFFINSWAHYFGSQTYSIRCTARDSWILAFLTWGEGWHNYHHRFPFDYRNGPRTYDWDPGKWMIYGFSKLGWCWNLKQTPEVEILKAKMETAKLKEPAVASPLLSDLEAKVLKAYQTWNQIHLSWNQKDVVNRVLQSREWKSSRRALKQARKDFFKLYFRWKREFEMGLRTQIRA